MTDPDDTAPGGDDADYLRSLDGLDALDERDSPPPPDAGDESSQSKAENKFPSFDAWFDAWLSAIIARKLSSSAGKNRVFCPQWWQHPEVVVRLHALWTAWEAAAGADDGAAMSGWWVHHADPQLRTMFDAENGPMHLCSRDSHKPTPPLRALLLDAPAGWFDDLSA